MLDCQAPLSATSDEQITHALNGADVLALMASGGGGLLAPSSWHGVTTVVMGNCGVGFAPAKPDKHDWLIGLMEGVEDIPGTALAEGLQWNWESFPEYMDALEELPRTVDVATHVPHGPVRAYVMGERGASDEPPTEGEIAQMSAIVEDGLQSGALGFYSSRTILHRSIDGKLVPGPSATKKELKCRALHIFDMTRRL